MAIKTVGMGKLKANSKAVLDIYMKQKKKNMTKAYMEIHPEASPLSAQVNGSELLNSPAGKLYTTEQVEYAKGNIIRLQGSEKDDISLRASQDILDRNEGKAIQQVIQKSTGVSLSIDLSGSTVNINPSSSN